MYHESHGLSSYLLYIIRMERQGVEDAGVKGSKTEMGFGTSQKKRSQKAHT